MKRLFQVFLFALVAALGTAAGAVPRLLVVVSVDQMRADYLDRYASEYAGGFKTLREGGAVFTQARHAHVPTETGPGHAAILTGKFPAQHGIVGNTWYDRALSTDVYCVTDSVHGLGPEHLLSYTLGDALKAKYPLSRVVSVSLKDRAAILMGGKRPDVVVWYDRKAGEFVTSTYYARPGWLERFNARLKAKGGPLAGASAADAKEFVYTPLAERQLLDLAEEALRREDLGRDDAPDILAIGFSATDFIGHRYGPDSPQIHEQLLRLDGLLAELLKEVESRVGKGRFDLVLTADHGVAPVVESPAGKELGARRLMWDEFHDALEKALQGRFKAAAPWIVGRDYPHLYLNRGQAEKMGHDWRQFLQAAAMLLEGVPGVARVYVADSLPAGDPFLDVMRRSVMDGRSGDLLVRVVSGAVVTDHPGGTDHSTPYDYDARVPLVFFGPDFKPGRLDAPALVTDLAPTGAAVLGVDFPPVPPSQVRRDVLK